MTGRIKAVPLLRHQLQANSSTAVIEQRASDLLTAYKVYEMDTLLSITINLLFCLCPLHTVNFPVNHNGSNNSSNNKNPAITDEGIKTEENSRTPVEPAVQCPGD